MATPALGFDELDLRCARRRRHHGDERQAQQRREIGLGDRCRPRGRFDDGGVLTDPAVAQRVEEQRPRQAVFQAAGDMGGLVLEVQRDVDSVAPGRRQRIAQQVSVGTAPRIGLDQPNRIVHPVAWLAARSYSRPRRSPHRSSRVGLSRPRSGIATAGGRGHQRQQRRLGPAAEPQRSERRCADARRDV